MHKHESPDVEQQLQVLDVGIVDVLSHLEALLRHSHSIQRALVQLRSEALRHRCRCLSNSAPRSRRMRRICNGSRRCSATSSGPDDRYPSVKRRR